MRSVNNVAVYVLAFVREHVFDSFTRSEARTNKAAVNNEQNRNYSNREGFEKTN